MLILSKRLVLSFMSIVVCFSFSRSSRADFFVSPTSMVGLDDSGGYINFTQSTIGAASGEYIANLNAAYAVMSVNLATLTSETILSVTVSGSIGILSPGGAPFLTPEVVLANQAATDLILSGQANPNNQWNFNTIFDGINSGMDYIGGGEVSPSGGSFSSVLTNQTAIQDMINVASANNGQFVLGLPAETGGQGLFNYSSLSLDFHTEGISPQAAVPEPASLTLACLGGAAIAFGRRLVNYRRKSQVRLIPDSKSDI